MLSQFSKRRIYYSLVAIFSAWCVESFVEELMNLFQEYSLFFSWSQIALALEI